MKRTESPGARIPAWSALGAAVPVVFILAALGSGVPRTQTAQKEDCLSCHGDRSLTKEKAGKTISLFLDDRRFSGSVHGSLACTGCHADLEGKDLPHEETPAAAQCVSCHGTEGALYAECLHGQAAARGDPLAPSCKDCHGYHDILRARNPRSAVAPLRVPFLCGKCHKEGSPVQLQREIHQDHILENYSESIHGEGLLKKGLVVSANCASCHSAHRILPHTDPRSTIARKNIAATCAQCHAQIEDVHRKLIKGQLWEKEASVLPACVDCHQPHKIRKVFYDQGMADRDCLLCHERKTLESSADGRSLHVDPGELSRSRHAKITCSQCHSEVTSSLERPCSSIKNKVDCAACHAAVAEEYRDSTHGHLAARGDPNAPVCLECHGGHQTLGKDDPNSPTFPTNVPVLCAKCHREGEKAALRYEGPEHEITSQYTESIHGKGLLKSGLVVTAMCSDCHTAHHELPHDNPDSSIYPLNQSRTCGRCHHGIAEKFQNSIHAQKAAKDGQRPAVCSDCHSAHHIRRTDADGFKLEIMNQCGKCHEEIAKTYFDTYHGKVTQLGFTKTAKCYDCHGAHDILPIADPRSRLNRLNVVGTCKKCHPGATRRFAGYLTHATHHDPDKYPFLFWTFWGMTGLLVTTFFFSGVHTLLWLPRALKMRRARKKAAQTPAANGSAEEEQSPPGSERENGN